MTREQKSEIVEKLSAGFESSNAVIVCDYKGLGVSALEGLRKSARENNSNVQVAKNSLASIALKNANIEGLELKDMNIFVWGDDAIDTSKSVSKFAESNKTFSIKSAYIDGEISDAARVEAFAKLPNREELLGMLLSVWQAPVRNFTVGLGALRDKKQEEETA